VDSVVAKRKRRTIKQNSGRGLILPLFDLNFYQLHQTLTVNLSPDVTIADAVGTTIG